MTKEELRKRFIETKPVHLNGSPLWMRDYAEWLEAEIEKRDKEIARMAGIITDRTHEIVRTNEGIENELIGLLDWLDWNYGGETNKDRVNTYLSETR